MHFQYREAVDIASFAAELLIVNVADGTRRTVPLPSEFRSAAWNPSDGSLWAALKKCPPGHSDAPLSRLCFIRANPASGDVSPASVEIVSSDNGHSAPDFRSMRGAFFSFSPSGKKMLIFDDRSGDNHFYVIGLARGAAEKRSFALPDGSPIRFTDLDWGRNDESFIFTYIGNIWVKIPAVEAPFPAVIGRSAVSTPVWLP